MIVEGTVVVVVVVVSHTTSHVPVVQTWADQAQNNKLLPRFHLNRQNICTHQNSQLYIYNIETPKMKNTKVADLHNILQPEPMLT